MLQVWGEVEQEVAVEEVAVQLEVALEEPDLCEEPEKQPPTTNASPPPPTEQQAGESVGGVETEGDVAGVCGGFAEGGLIRAFLTGLFGLLACFLYSYFFYYRT